MFELIQASIYSLSSQSFNDYFTCLFYQQTTYSTIKQINQSINERTNVWINQSINNRLSCDISYETKNHRPEE